MELFIDHTGFEPDDGKDPWNDWFENSDEPALDLTTHEGNSYAHFRNFQGSLQGEIISKNLLGLTPGQVYKVSLRVKRNRRSSKTPTLTFALDDASLMGSFAVIEPYWRTASWTFQASEHQHRLTLSGHDDSGYSDDDGADFSFDDIWIKPETITENFDSQPDQLIGLGESLELPSLTIHPLSGPSDTKLTGIVNLASMPGMREGPAIVLQYKSYNQNSRPVRIDLNAPCDKISFIWSIPYGTGHVSFHDEEHQVLREISYSSPANHEISFQAPAGHRIASMHFNGRYESYLDFFTLWQTPAQERPLLYIDHSNFEPHPSQDPWNGWRKGPNGQALVLTSDQEDNFAQFENFQGSLLGVVLGKNIQRLTPGTDYSLSMRVRRRGQSSKTPTLSFDLDHAPIDGSFAVTDNQWLRLHWQFTACKETHRLELIARDDIGDGSDPGADFCFDDIRIQPAVVHEHFDGVLERRMEVEESVELSTMRITVLPGSTPPLLIRDKHTNEVPGMQTEGGLRLISNQVQPYPPRYQQVRLDLTAHYAAVKFAWTWLKVPAQVDFFDAQGELLEHREIDASLENRHFWVEYRAPTEKSIARIELRTLTASFVDSFTFWST
ncbi:hypothetical protein [Pseudomonas sp. SBB6]|uniref:hypothetical protein n=1 Tax=Pseudomonas sp. SBB6 TaxID=2962032 RepID=UPI0020B7697C|nr:hypothetical protein [Pseudomonas sp. SBB6]MCP3750475.1 hypothetical protein [Pseudomonas sp. SBB6]